MSKPIPRRQILDSSKLKEFADDNFKFEENGKRVENTVGKEEIARYEQFLFFPQCFQKACFQEASKGVIVWEWVKIKMHTTFDDLGSTLSKILLGLWKKKIHEIIIIKATEKNVNSWSSDTQRM